MRKTRSCASMSSLEECARNLHRVVGCVRGRVRRVLLVGLGRARARPSGEAHLENWPCVALCLLFHEEKPLAAASLSLSSAMPIHPCRFVP